MLSEVEVRAIAKQIVDKAKKTAHYEQGSLKRSIAFTYYKGVVTFRQLYYGQWNENSQLEKYASQMMPNGVPYKIELTVLGGDTYETGRTKMGRKSQRVAVASAKRVSSKSIKALINKVQNGKKEDKKNDRSREDN